MKTGIVFKKGYLFFILLLVIAAICKSLNAPGSALLLQGSNPLVTMVTMTFGSLIVGLVTMFFSRKKENANPNSKIVKKDTPYILLIILADLLGNILFLFGLSMSIASSASLIKCFGVVATAILAFVLLKEKISKRLWIAILLITLGCITISIGNSASFIGSPGLLLVFASCICSGFSYTYKKKLADRNPGKLLVITNSMMVIVGLILIAILGIPMPDITNIISGILLGIIVFGVTSILFQFSARALGASKCTATMSIAPFIGAGISFIIFQQVPTLSFYVAFLILIPGFYLVMIDKEEKKKIDGEAEQGPPLEIHHDVRNYLSSLGFALIFAVALILLFEYTGDYTGIIGTGMLINTAILIAIVQFIIGCLLIVFHRRDVTGMIMLLTGVSTALIKISGVSSIFALMIGILNIIFGVVILLSNESKKYLYSVLFLLIGVSTILENGTFVNESIIIVLYSIICVYLFGLVIGSSGIIPRFPFTRTLTSDEPMEFGRIGSVICYVIIAVSILPLMGAYIFGTEILSIDIIAGFTLACGIMVGITALLMMCVGKNRFISVVFLWMMVSMLIAGTTGGITHYVSGILMVIIGLFCLLRKRSYLLLGILCLLYGISSFTSFAIYGESVLLVSQFLMHAITFITAIYLAFAVIDHRKKLPLF